MKNQTYAMIALAPILTACQPSTPTTSKPTGSKYLGKWEAQTQGALGGPYRCPLEISKNGESFLITVDKTQAQSCGFYEGIFTLTPEGNLTGGSMGATVVYSYDKEKDRVALSFRGVQYLKNR